MKTKKLRFLALLLSVLLMASMLPPAAFADEPFDLVATAESILHQHDLGNSSETFTEYSLDNLSEYDILNNPHLQQFFYAEAQNLGNQPSTYSMYSAQRNGVLYVYEIEDISGNNVVYYLRPYTVSVYSEIPDYGTTTWTTKFCVTEYAYVNGVLDSTSILPSEISCQNIYGRMGIGGNAAFYDNLVVTSEALSLPSINSSVLGILASFVGIEYSTAAAILSAFSSISFPSSSSGSTLSVYEDHLVGAKYNSRIKINIAEEVLKLSATLGTVDSSAAANTSCPFAIKWSFDVYKGNALYTSTYITTTGTTTTNQT